MKPVSRKPHHEARMVTSNWRASVDMCVRILEQKDPYTKGHSQRVQRGVNLLSAALRWPTFRRRCASVAALLHDVGKIIVERSTINNQGPTLTIEQREELTDHPYNGAQIVMGLFPTEVTLGILQHHERWDGRISGSRRGYPFGLRGQEITPIARAIAIADAYDALTSKRSYNIPLPSDIALQRLAEESGAHFDPKMLHVFITKVGPKLRRGI